MRRLSSVVALALLSTFAVPAAIATTASPSTPSYDVTITRTEYGIPHITANDYGSLGYGYGYAFAQDNLCTMAADYVTVLGERSRYFGPTATYTMQGNGVTVNNLDSDIFWTQVRQSHIVDQMLTRPAPLGLKPEIKVAVEGYVADYNRWIDQVGGPAGLTRPGCQCPARVAPIHGPAGFLPLLQLILLAGQD